MDLEAVHEAVEPSWLSIFQMLDSVAGRVGNTMFPLDSCGGSAVQKRLTHLDVHSMFICRGTEKFQVPLQSPDPKTAPLRYSVGMHRMSQEVTDFGGEQWGQLSRTQRTRKCMPCKLMLTVFARPREVADPPPLQPVPQSRGVEDLERLPAQPLRPGDERRDLHVRVQPSDLCEGWGPPPVPLHGPKFRALDVSRKQELIQLHKNLGHPDPQKLASHLRARKSLPEVIEAALDYVCDTCVESTKPRHQRPGKLHDPQEFNQTVGLDGFFWSGKAGFQVHVFHCLDEASLFPDRP